MTIEAMGLVVEQSGVGVRVRVRQLKKVIRKRKCKSDTRKKNAPAALQKLFVTSRDVFKGHGTVPKPDHVRNLCRIIDNLKPEDFGLRNDLPFFRPNGAVKGIPRVTTTTIYSCENFSLCLFFLPATGVIPLHNHPGMTVFSKLLLGTMHIKAYDWVDSADSYNFDNSAPSSQFKLARLKANKVFKAPCNSSVLYPTSGGNIHAFTAITPCIVLDVLGPPYSKDDGRDCTYYKDIPHADLLDGEGVVATEAGECYGWLEEIEMPENSEMDVIEYLGPQIVDTIC